MLKTTLNTKTSISHSQFDAVQKSEINERINEKQLGRSAFTGQCYDAITQPEVLSSRN